MKRLEYKGFLQTIGEIIRFVKDKKDYTVSMIFDLKKTPCDEETPTQKIPLVTREYSPPPELPGRKRFQSSGGTPFQYTRANELLAALDPVFAQMVILLFLIFHKNEFN